MSIPPSLPVQPPNLGDLTEHLQATFQCRLAFPPFWLPSFPGSSRMLLGYRQAGRNLAAGALSTDFSHLQMLTVTIPPLPVRALPSAGLDANKREAGCWALGLCNLPRHRGYPGGPPCGDPGDHSLNKTQAYSLFTYFETGSGCVAHAGLELASQVLEPQVCTTRLRAHVFICVCIHACARVRVCLGGAYMHREAGRKHRAACSLSTVFL